MWYDQASNRCNIMSFAIVERTDEELLKKVFSEKLSASFQRMRSKMVKIADTYFFKEMSGDELAREMANAVKVIPSLSSMDEVSELMASE